MIINECRGKFVRKGSRSPIGWCDRSGFPFSHDDLHKQMEWRGDRLVWTGMMVGVPYLDIPNEQNKSPIVKADPEVVENPRPRSEQSPVASSQLLNYREALARLQNIKWGNNG